MAEQSPSTSKPESEAPEAPATPPQRNSTEIQPAPAKPSTKPMPVWKVILHNDDENDIPYVIETIMMLTRLSKPEARQRTMEANEKGLSLILTTHQERAELYQQQFTSRKLTVTIEPG